MHAVTFTHVGKSIDLLKHKEYLCRLKPKCHHGMHAVTFIQMGRAGDLLKHLSSIVDLLDYKAYDHNMITHRERYELIATGRALSLKEELLPPHRSPPPSPSPLLIPMMRRE